MADFCRELNTDVQVEAFVDKVLCIKNIEEKRKAINLIAEAERNMKDYYSRQTLTRCENRDFEYREDEIRQDLRKQIVTELFKYKRLVNDDKIKLGKGGAAPRTNVKCEKKAFFIIGPPASGKSGVANKVADRFGCYILDSDFAKRKLPEYKNQVGGASLVHEESDALIFEKDGLMDVCTDNGANLVIPKIGHDINSIESFCLGLKKGGYEIFLISIDLDRTKATRRAYNRFLSTERYVPLSLIFDGYGNQPTLNYFKIKQKNDGLFSGFSQISTDVPKGSSVILLETINMDELKTIEWR